MIDALYADSTLVELYDAFNAGTENACFYRRMIGAEPRRILDLGCGTGRFAAELAAAGHLVVGVDPAPAMLAVARRRPGGQAVRWIEGDTRAIPAALRVDAVVMTGHAFQCLLTDEAVSAMLATARAVLVPGGQLMFDSRNPLIRPWDEWTPEISRRTVTDSAGKPVSAWHTVTDVRGDLVTFVTDYDLAGRRLRSRSTLRFLPPTAIEGELRAAGFNDIVLSGDWRGAPLRTESREIVVVAT